MLRIVKHIAASLLCLLVVGGSVGVHFYVFTCADKNHSAQIALNRDISCCSAAEVQCCGAASACPHLHEDDEDEYTLPSDVVSLSPLNCCNSDAQVFLLDQFEVKQGKKQSVLLQPIFLLQAVQGCNAGIHCCACQRTAQCDFSPPSPLFGRAMLLQCSLLRL
jgi:hypothetical protein